MSKGTLKKINSLALACGCLAAFALVFLTLELPAAKPLPHAEAAAEAPDDHAGHDHAAPTTKAAPPLKVDDCCEAPANLEAGHEDHVAPPAAADHHDHEHAAASGPEGVQWCGEHNVAEAECGICQPARTATLKPGEGLKIRMASDTGLEDAGVTVGAPLNADPAGEAIHLARATYNLDKMAHVSPRLPGVIEEVLAGPGNQVKKGAPLVRISSTQVAEAHSTLKSAEADEALAREIFDREKMLWEKEVSSTQEYRSAEAALKQAGIKVRLAREAIETAGLRPEDLSTASGSLLTVRAPLDGTIVDWHAVVGETVDESVNIATIADLSNMWLELAIPASAISRVAVGDKVNARFEGFEGLVLEGTINWIASQVDPESRTIAARALVPNPGAVLRDGMTGKVSIRREGSVSSLGVPVDAVQEYDGKPYVFLKLSDDLYEVRQVTLGAREHDTVAVLEGIQPDDEIVLARSFTVKSEFLKSRLGAGCADH